MKREEGGEQFSLSYEPPPGLNPPWGREGDPGPQPEAGQEGLTQGYRLTH